jgi:hypothetical protein
MNLKSFVSVLAIIVIICLLLQFSNPFLPSSFGDLGYKSFNDFLINQQLRTIDLITYNKHNIRDAHLLKGVQEMATTSASILGVARNIGHKLPNVLLQVSSFYFAYGY